MEFAGFDHVDTRVRSLRAVERFYDALMPRLGLTRKHCVTVVGDEWTEVACADPHNGIEYFAEPGDGNVPAFIGFIEDPQMTPTLTRIAFRVRDRAELAAWHRFLAEIGAQNVEPSGDMENYPAIFFEDPAGTRLEVCARKR